MLCCVQYNAAEHTLKMREATVSVVPSGGAKIRFHRLQSLHDTTGKTNKEDGTANGRDLTIGV